MSLFLPHDVWIPPLNDAAWFSNDVPIPNNPMRDLPVHRRIKTPRIERVTPNGLAELKAASRALARQTPDITANATTEVRLIDGGRSLVDSHASIVLTRSTSYALWSLLVSTTSTSSQVLQVIYLNVGSERAASVRIIDGERSLPLPSMSPLPATTDNAVAGLLVHVVKVQARAHRLYQSVLLLVYFGVCSYQLRAHLPKSA